ncbi:FAD-binding and (Fe-S)-binding domain-containing protein [Streptomyces daliensis]
MTTHTPRTGIDAAREETRRALDATLSRELDGDTAFDDVTRQLFSRDASMYAITPLGVVFPRHTGDITAAVRAAAEHGVPVLPRGAGTSLAGQTVGPGLVLDLSRHMRRVLDIDPEARTAHVEAGVVQDQLNREAAAHGLMFGPDTSTSNRATLGGMIGNNSAGSGSVRYGMTIDHVRALDVVLSDGTPAHLAPLDEAARARRASAATLEGRIHRELPAIAATFADAIATGFPAHTRRACGYRLDRLPAPGQDGVPFDPATFVVGSEGTLVTVASALVGLVPRPSRTVIAVGHFTSVPAAIAATEDALACDPSAVELMDRTILELSRQRLEYASLGTILTGDPGALLFVSFTGGDEDERELTGKLERLTALWRRHGHGYHTLKAVTPAEQSALLKVRKSSLGLLMAASEGTRRPLAFVEDTAVAPADLAAYTERFKGVLDRHGLEAGFYGHCSVGCLHIRPFVDVADPGQVETMRAVAEEVKELVAEFGGVNSSEHGDGLARSEFNREIFGPELYEAMRQVKRVFDPEDRMNPGKIVDAPAMTEHLRDATLTPPAPLRTHLDFEVIGPGGASGGGGDSGNGGGAMRAAADRCMNIGLCRKTDAGVMCPSYMATRNEEDSTRGRAGALVQALSSPDPHAALGGDRLHEVLDLCLMCKACASECPLGVDMATLKAEALAHRHEERGVPLRSRIFGAIRRLNRMGSATAPVANLLSGLRPLRLLADRTVGVSARRPLPRFVRRNLVRWFRTRRRVGSDATARKRQGTLVFLADSFTSYTEPGVGRAAIELLERAGWDVRLESGGCCGRAALSKGLLEDAKSAARGLARAVSSAAPPGSPVTGCEPSCLMTLKDEHVRLLPEEATVRDLAGRVRQAEELILEAVDDGRLRLSEDAWPSGRELLYHGHCHQKAEVGTAATVALLRRIPGARVRELDAGCCGMAGSFGYEAEHYELSMTVGEDRLFPAVKAADAETVVVATGTSCRQQIAHGTGRGAIHPLEAVRAALAPKHPEG